MEGLACPSQPRHSHLYFHNLIVGELQTIGGESEKMSWQPEGEVAPVSLLVFSLGSHGVSQQDERGVMS